MSAALIGTTSSTGSRTDVLRSTDTIFNKISLKSNIDIMNWEIKKFVEKLPTFKVLVQPP